MVCVFTLEYTPVGVSLSQIEEAWLALITTWTLYIGLALAVIAGVGSTFHSSGLIAKTFSCRSRVIQAKKLAPTADHLVTEIPL
jgi:hypothetical protein